MVGEDLANTALSNLLFTRLIAKTRTFTRVDFKYTIFGGCYLRNCTFDSL
jgi:hypothetical protein